MVLAKDVLYLNQKYFFILKYSADNGSNNIVEVYALWILLKFSISKDITYIQIFGDSKLFISWCNNQCIISNLTLPPILDRVLEARSRFQNISFEHVYREFNSKADALLKKALLLEEGTQIS